MRDSQLYIYRILEDDRNEKDYVSFMKFPKKHLYVKADRIRDEKKVVGYAAWYRNQTNKKPSTIHVNYRSGRDLLKLDKSFGNNL